MPSPSATVRRASAAAARHAIALPLSAALTIACAAPGARPDAGAAADSLRAAGTAGRDTVTIAMLEHELLPHPETRGFNVIASHDLATGPVERLTELAPSDTISAPFLRIGLLRSTADARDLLDSGAAGFAGPADVLVTRDPTVIAYARARPGFATLPLPWDRVHAAIIVDPARTRIAASDELRASLARDAVRADARPAGNGYAWQTAACAGAGPRAAQPERRVVYAAADPVGRAVAERLVAMDGTVTAAALGDDSLAAALAAGADAVYVVTIPIAGDTTDACTRLPARPASARIVPLVETRAHAIVRDGTPALVIAPGEPVRYETPQTR